MNYAYINCIFRDNTLLMLLKYNNNLLIDKTYIYKECITIIISVYIIQNVSLVIFIQIKLIVGWYKIL